MASCATGNVPEAPSGTPLPCKVCFLGLLLPSLQAGGPCRVAVFSQEQAPLTLVEGLKLGWSETFLPIFQTELEEEGETLFP